MLLTEHGAQVRLVSLPIIIGLAQIASNSHLANCKQSDSICGSFCDLYYYHDYKETKPEEWGKLKAMF